jgi:hypothetical protein
MKLSFSSLWVNAAFSGEGMEEMILPPLSIDGEQDIAVTFIRNTGMLTFLQWSAEINDDTMNMDWNVQKSWHVQNERTIAEAMRGR